MEDEMQQLKVSLAKYARSEVLTLSEAGSKIGVAEKYLAELIRRGKIKAFKVGNDWLLEARWLDDFRDQIRAGLNQEIAERFALGGPEYNIWSRKISPARQTFDFSFLLKFSEVMLALLLIAVFSAGLAWQSSLGRKINDEKLTYIIYQLSGRKSIGVVAGEYEIKGGIR